MSPIERWFHKVTEGLVRHLANQFDIRGPRYDLIIWDINDLGGVIPPYYQELLRRLDVRYITVVGHAEVNALVFLDGEMNKFAEREIYWEGA